MSDSHDSDFAAKLELAWAAGFFDGEGCTHLAGRKSSAGHTKVYIRMTIAQVVRENLERWQRAVGEGTINGPHDKGHQPVWVLQIASGRVKAALEKLWPYLGDAKKRQAEEMLAKGTVGRGMVKDRGTCVYGHPMTPENSYRKENGRIRCKTCTNAAFTRAKAKADDLGGRVGSTFPERLKTHCKRGHEYAVHAGIGPTGYRCCRACIRDKGRENQRRYRAKKKAAEGD